MGVMTMGLGKRVDRLTMGWRNWIDRATLLSPNTQAGGRHFRAQNHTGAHKSLRRSSDLYRLLSRKVPHLREPFGAGFTVAAMEPECTNTEREFLFFLRGRGVFDDVPVCLTGLEVAQADQLLHHGVKLLLSDRREPDRAAAVRRFKLLMYKQASFFLGSRYDRVEELRRMIDDFLRSDIEQGRGIFLPVDESPAEEACDDSPLKEIAKLERLLMRARHCGRLVDIMEVVKHERSFMSMTKRTSYPSNMISLNPIIFPQMAKLQNKSGSRNFYTTFDDFVDNTLDHYEEVEHYLKGMKMLLGVTGIMTVVVAICEIVSLFKLTKR